MLKEILASIWEDPPVRWMLLLPIICVFTNLMGIQSLTLSQIVMIACIPALFCMAAELIGYGFTLGVFYALHREWKGVSRIGSYWGIGLKLGTSLGDDALKEAIKQHKRSDT